MEGLSSVNYKNLGTDRGQLFTHLDLELRELVVDSLKTEFMSAGAIKKPMIDTTENNKCSYVKMENTRICEEYGHTMILKYLRKKLLTFDDASKQCDELG